MAYLRKTFIYFNHSRLVTPCSNRNTILQKNDLLFKWLTTHVVDIHALSLAEVNIAKAAASECLSLLGVCVSVHP